MKLVIISDTHGFHREVTVPAGDVLIHCGDITKRGNIAELDDFNEWLGELPFKHRLVIAGNHDWCFEKAREASEAKLTNAIYLQDSEAVIDHVKFYGSPWQPRFYDWAFNLDRGLALKEKWDLIPKNTDVLITHGPPKYTLDINSGDSYTGCADLNTAVFGIAPLVHCFGHIHEAYGRFLNSFLGTEFVNASICDLWYNPVNKPIEVEI